jgi:hypothetical protein
MVGPDRQVRCLHGRQFNVRKEETYIVRCASRQEARVVVIGPLLFFSTETRDAWVLDPEDGLARCLCKDGRPLSSGITETDASFSIAWEARYRFDGDSMIFANNSGGRRIVLGYPVREIQEAIDKSRTSPQEPG